MISLWIVIRPTVRGISGGDLALSRNNDGLILRSLFELQTQVNRLSDIFDL